MDYLIERLKTICDDMELLTELTLKYKDNKVVGDMLMYKKIEDGIIEKFNLASEYQLNYMKDRYTFRYYDKEMMVKVIDAQIIKNSRRDKMKKLTNR